MLVARGWRCVLLARGRDRLERAAQMLGADYEVCDVADRDDADRAAAAVRDRHGRIAALVNSAGIPGRSTLLEADPQRIEDVVRVNYLGSVWSVRAFLPLLEANGGGDVVNVVSVAGTVAWPASGPYSASKHAQLAFSRALGPELRRRNIRVHTVNPGFVETEGFPQATTLRSPLLRRVVIGPERVGVHIASVLETDRRETFIPAWYRAAAIVQAVAPGLVSRMLR